MVRVSFDEIQQDVPRFLDRIAAGESVLIVRDEQPVAEVHPLPQTPPEPRPIGLCAGEFTVPDDFDEPLPDEVLRLFEGS